MSAKRFVQVLLPIALAGVIAASLILIISPVGAQEEAAPALSSSCIVCHEDLYYLYDTGKWYCVAEARDRCADCHAGNPNSIQIDVAHTGLIAYPVVNGDVTKCKECHPQDYSAHVQKFAETAGFPVVYVAEPVTISSQSGNVLPAAPITPKRYSPYEVEVAVALGLVILVLLAVTALKTRKRKTT